MLKKRPSASVSRASISALATRMNRLSLSQLHNFRVLVYANLRLMFHV